jgi:hypothetical protein
LKTPMVVVALAVVALSLAPASNSCQAGTVTYDFVEGTGAPNPGETGATITVFSPPASATHGWIISQLSDISSITIIDPGLLPSGFTGGFTVASGVLQGPLTSNTGSQIDLGTIADHIPFTKFFDIFSLATSFSTIESGNNVPGEWIVAAAAVPEPASAVSAGIAIAIGLGLAAFRKRNEVRRQRPVGPLHANQ